MNDNNSTKNCIVCGKSLEGMKSNAKCCGPTCRAKNWKQKQAKPQPKKVSIPLQGVITKSVGQNQSKPVKNTHPNISNFFVSNTQTKLNRLYDEQYELKIQLQNLENINGDLYTQLGSAYAKSNKLTGWGDTASTLVGTAIDLSLGLFTNSYTIFKKSKKTVKEKMAANSKMISHYEKQLKSPSLNPVVQIPATHHEKTISGLTVQKDPISKNSIPTLSEIAQEPNNVQASKNPKIISVEELMKMEYKLLDFKSPWLRFIGQPEINFFKLIYGMPGSGKSTYAIDFATYLSQNFGKVLYISGEEGFSKTLSDKFRSASSPNGKTQIADLKTFEEIESELQENSYHFIVIDSLNTLKISVEEMKKLRTLCPETAFIAVAQSTKSGQMRGSQEFIHDCDIEILVERGSATTIKNRFLQAGQEFEVFKA